MSSIARFPKFVLWAVESLSRILGPLLFLILINDLPNCLWFCQPKMYADHTHITYASADLDSVQSSLNRDLSNIHKWLLCNKLTLNTTNTKFMSIGSRQKLSTLSESLSTTKSLRILIDDNIAWHNHINKLFKKIWESGSLGVR